MNEETNEGNSLENRKLEKRQLESGQLENSPLENSELEKSELHHIPPESRQSESSRLGLDQQSVQHALPETQQELKESELFNQSLMHENSLILNILPSVIKDLYHHESHLQVLLNYIDNQVSVEPNDQAKEKLQQLKLQALELIKSKPVGNNKNVLVIDENKSILLSFMFGRLFSDCLTILSSEDNVRLIVINEDEEDTVQEIGEYYLNSLELPTNAGLSILLIRVKHDKLIRKKSGPDRRINKRKLTEIKHRLVFLELKKLLDNVGLTINSEGNIAQPSDPVDPQDTIDEMKRLREELNSQFVVRTEEHAVDLNNWYCSCDDYQICYTKEEEEEEEEEEDSDVDSPPSSPTPYIVPASQLIAKYANTSQDSVVLKLLRGCPTNHLSPVPICPHLLSLLILLYNKDINPKYTVIHSSSIWSIM